MYKKVSIKRGNTFMLHGTVRMPDPVLKDRHGKPVMVEMDISEWDIRSEARLGDKLIAAFVVEKRPDVSPGAYLLTHADTTLWPISQAIAFDVKYTLPTGQIVSTASIAIDCKQDNTR